MKQATGELTSMIVAIILGAILIAFFYVIIWPTIKTNFQRETQCEKAKCNAAPQSDNSDGKVWCRIGDGELFECNYKG